MTPRVITAEAIIKIFPTGQANNPWLGIRGSDLTSPTIAKDIGLPEGYEGVVSHFFLVFTLMGDFNCVRTGTCAIFNQIAGHDVHLFDSFRIFEVVTIDDSVNLKILKFATSKKTIAVA